MQMHNGTRTGEGSFNVALKNIFYTAGHHNRYKLVAAFPEFFGTEVPEFEIFSKPENRTIQHLFDLAAQYGGSIVFAETLQPYEHDQAEASGRIATDVNGRKFIWTPDIEDFPENEDEADFFDRWYPLEMEVPEGLFEEIMERINKLKDTEPEDDHHQELIDTLQSIVDCAANDPDGMVSRKRIEVAKELLSKINS